MIGEESRRLFNNDWREDNLASAAVWAWTRYPAEFYKFNWQKTLNGL